MEFWEFLIQKDGDRSWLPLESPDVEVLEGRYRVVARTSRVTTAVEIRISHLATAENPPKRRIQKRSGQTNRDGLIVVIPFTRLQPGLWELRCTGDLMADLMGDSWQHTVKLQVLSHATATEGDWEPDWQLGEDQPIDDQPEENQPPENAALEGDRTSELQVHDQEVSLTPPPVEPEPQPRSPNTQHPTPNPAPAPPSVEPEPDLLEFGQLFEPVAEAADAEGVAPPISASISDDVLHAATERADAPSTSLSGYIPEEPQPAVEQIEPQQIEPQQIEPQGELQGEQEQPESVEATLEPRLNAPAIATSSVFQLAAQMSEEVVNAIFQDFDDLENEFIRPAAAEPSHPAAADRSSSPSSSNESADEQPREADPSQPASEPTAGVIDLPPVYQPSGLPIQVTLDRDTYMARRGGVLVLSGRVESLPSTEAALTEAVPTTVPTAQLHVYLRDPRTTHVLVKTVQPMAAASLPLSFACNVPIPADCQTQLLLGELILATVPQPGEPPLHLASQSFQVTADLNELLEAIANAFPESDEIQPPLEFTSPAAANLDLTFLEFLQSPKPMLQFQPSEQEGLPPQLQPTNASRTKTIIHFSSSSDTFSLSEISDQQRPGDQQRPDIVSSDESTADIPPPMSSDVPTNAPLSLADILADEVLEDKAVSSDVWSQTTDVPPSRPLAPQIAPEPPASPEDAAFRSLNLKGRFLSRLNALATDAELSSWLQHDPLEPLPVGEAPLGLDTDLAAQEVVVEDEPPPPLLPWTASAYQPPHKAVEPPKPPMLADDEPVPVPEFDVPPGELTSGQSIFVTVRLPQLKPRIYVKLWIRDRQTRSLLDGPRWLVAFVPDGAGYLETRTQLTVPYGCLEAQFEAIAVEMATQRESNKITIDRNIMPPDLPTLSVDDVSL